MSEKLGVYTVVGIPGKSAAKIKCLGLLEGEGGVRDTCIEQIPVSKYITGHAYACNITGDHLIASKRQPVVYVDVIYNKSLVRYMLYTLRIMFEIESEIKTEKQLLGSKLHGKFVTEIIMDGKTRVLDSEGSKLTKFPGTKEIVAYLAKFIKDPSMTSIMDGLIEKYDIERTKKYSDFYDNLKIPVPTVGTNYSKTS